MRALYSLALAAGCISFALSLPASAEPPAHAPAHGYRAKHGDTHKHSSGVELTFDSGKGVYVAVGLPDVFFHEGNFYRQEGGKWEVSVRADSGWGIAARGSLPSSIEDTHSNSVASTGKGKKRK